MIDDKSCSNDFFVLIYFFAILYLRYSCNFKLCFFMYKRFAKTSVNHEPGNGHEPTFFRVALSW